MKNLLILFALIFSCTLFISCSPDEDMPIPTPEPMPMPEPEPELEPDILDIPAAGLQVYMNFNENADDHSDNEHHGIVHGGVYVADRKGAEEGAYHFAAGDYIQLPNDEELGFGGKEPYSIGAFIRLDSLNEDSRSDIITKFNGGVLAGWYLSINGAGGVGAYRNSSPWSIFTDTKLELDTYYHVLSTFDGDILRIFIDGEMIRESAPWSSHPNDDKTPTLIGAIHNGGEISTTFHGDIDDLIIYDRALTDTEIKNMIED